MDAFVRRHVPPGSFVMGSEDFYYYAVARSGSEYRSIERTRGAEWTRWVPLFDPEASRPEQVVAAATARYMIWPRDRLVYPLVHRYGCAIGHEIAVYHAPPDDLSGLGPLARDPGHTRLSGHGPLSSAGQLSGGSAAGLALPRARSVRAQSRCKESGESATVGGFLTR